MNPSDGVLLNAGQGSRVAIAALAVWCLVALLKSSIVPIDFAPKARPWIAFGAGQAYAVFENVVAGTPWGMAAVAGLMATMGAISAQELGQTVKNSGAPPGAVLFLVAVLGGASLGCGGQLQQVTEFAEASRDFAAIAEPCLVAQKPIAEKQCEGDAECLAKVAAVYDTAADVLDVMHAGWCALSPKSEGCK